MPVFQSDDIFGLNAIKLDQLKFQGVIGSLKTNPLAYMKQMKEYSKWMTIIYPNLGPKLLEFSLNFMDAVDEYEWSEAVEHEWILRSELHHNIFAREFSMAHPSLSTKMLKMYGKLKTRSEGPPGSGRGDQGDGKKKARLGNDKPVYVNGVCHNWNVGKPCLATCKARSWKHQCEQPGCGMEHKTSEHPA
jgi:hypothetical protein